MTSRADRRTKDIKIIIDGMGGDNAPREIVKGCVEAVMEYGISIQLTGDGQRLEDELKRLNAPMEHFKIILTVLRQMILLKILYF